MPLIWAYIACLRSEREHFYFLEISWSFYPTYGLRSKRLRAVSEQRTRTARKMAPIKERGGGREEKKETRFLPSPPPTPSFIFWLSFHFSRGQNRKSRYWDFLRSKTKRKRLLGRLPQIRIISTLIAPCCALKEYHSLVTKSYTGSNHSKVNILGVNRSKTELDSTQSY